MTTKPPYGPEHGHRHPTFGVCECGHLDFMHPWVQSRIEYRAGCTECACEAFHADPLTIKG